tara:strand:- start:1517 stop:2590 length:1074 start_codon:yes stop_codon:yes gene_type:complete
MSYTRLADNDIVTRQATELVTSTWTNNVNNLSTAHTSSTQASYASSTSSGHFYVEVYQTGAAASDAEVQYSVAYGHRYGSGSPDFTNDTGSFGLGASRVTYSQYRQLVFGDDKDSNGNTQYFQFGSHTPDDIYIINVNRSRYKQKLTLGSLNLHISGTDINNAIPSQSIIKLTDDSVTTSAGQGNSNLGTYYNIVSGSNGQILTGDTAATQVGGSGSYGLYYPEAGLVILNGGAFTSSLAPVRSAGGPAANTDRNTGRLFNAISGAGHFIVDTTEEVNSQFYFIRARNDQFNYTNNPSFVDSSHNIRFETMKLNPKVFITTVGLYNDAFELLAIAKLSQPVAKDFTKEALIRVKLDY